MKHKSLFSGIGGFDLAAQWMGWQNIGHTEWNEFGQKVLNYHWPKAKSHGDITKTDYTIYRNRVDILTGGFPCQPYSVAGKRKGKEDERHLWPEMLRAIREIAPRWVVGENVGGLVNWNGGMVFDEVQADLEAEGYEVLPFLLPAASVNAPHKRDRIWFVAFKDTNCNGRNGKLREEESSFRKQRNTSTGNNERISPNHDENRYVANTSSERFIDRRDNRQERYVQNNINGNASKNQPKRYGRKCRFSAIRNNGNVTDSNITSSGREFKQQSEQGQFGGCNSGDKRISSNANSIKRSEGGVYQKRREAAKRYTCTCNPRDSRSDWKNFPTQSPVCNGDDGFPTESLRQFFREDSNGVISEEEIDKILSSAYTQWRNETIKAGGNAIVPQVVYQIFKAIEQYESGK